MSTPIEHILTQLRTEFRHHVRLEERRPGLYQVVAPLFHEDGDMVQVFMRPNGRTVRVTDAGLSLMRLSYTYDIDTPNKERILERILSDNGVVLEDGEIHLDVEADRALPAVLQLATVVGKVCAMDYFRREVLQSQFWERLRDAVDLRLKDYPARSNVCPLSDHDEYCVDYVFDLKPHPVFLFGVNGHERALLVTIACQQFQLQRLSFQSVVVHDNWDILPKKDLKRLTGAVDKQFPSMEAFQDGAPDLFTRWAA